MTAAGGVWATYNREAGWAKFWLILASIFLYYALARQPRENLWLVTSLLSLLVAYRALNFLLSPDLPRQSADFEIITKIKRGWLDLRPALTIHAPLPNISAGILAMLIPFPLALGVRAWRERNTSITLLTMVAGGLALFSLLLSSSRGAWLALAVTGGIGLLWRLSQFAAKRVGKSPYLILGLCLFVVAGQLFWLSLTYPGGPMELANRLPGVPSGGSRLELVHAALNLIIDFPFTGGGLGAFAGLYSQYVMVIPHFLFSYSHNFYLDVALEQGLLGLLALVVVILGSAWLLVKSIYLSPGTNNSHSIGTVVLASLLVVILHGLVDDALYGNQATPQLFLLPGMAIAATRPDGGLNRVHVPRLDLSKVLTPGLENRTRWIGAALVFVTALIAPLIILREPITAAWLANLGAVEMARIELADFPSGRWDDGHNVNALAPTATVLKRALQLNPQNRTANHRLGMIAMVQRDFNTATFHLQQAYIADPDHRGVTKALGYCYTWAGKLNEAVRLLANIPEAEREMEVYVWWWRTQERGDLADQAAQMAALLELTHARPKGNN